MAQPSFRRVPTSLDPSIARELHRVAFENEVSKSSVVEVALRELLANGKKIPSILRRYGASKKRRNE